MMQVAYGYQRSGLNFPPFGCLHTDNVSAALNLRFPLFNLVTYISTDSLQGVGCLAIAVCNGAYLSTDPHSHNHRSSTPPRCGHHTHLYHLDKAERMYQAV